MRAWVPFAKYLAAAGIALLFTGICFAQQPLRRGRIFEGFKELKWGATIEESLGIYPDLYFDRYAILHGREAPSKVYLRKGSDVIDTVAFDSSEYWFREDRFFRYKATMHSKVGPRTLVTRAEDGFDKIFGKLKQEYGEPSEYETSYVSEILSVVRKASWKTGSVTMTLEYVGPRDSNEDLLIIEIGKTRGGAGS